jgi:hypothetical protein
MSFRRKRLLTFVLLFVWLGKIEVDHCTELAASRTKDSMEDVQGQSSLDAKEMDEIASDELNNAAAPHERTALVKAMFKFVLHMMESSGTADGLRNLIESSLPQSLKLVVEQPQVFGNSVFALAINVMSTFIHNEPTSLPILQEAKLPQSFLDTITNYTTVSTDVCFNLIHNNVQRLKMSHILTNYSDIGPACSIKCIWSNLS